MSIFTFQFPETLVAVVLNGLVPLLTSNRTVSTPDASITVALNACNPELTFVPFGGLEKVTSRGVAAIITTLFDCATAPSPFPSLGYACTVQLFPITVSFETITPDWF